MSVNSRKRGVATAIVIPIEGGVTCVPVILGEGGMACHSVLVVVSVLNRVAE